MQAPDPIAAVREQDATGEIAAIFSDLQATLRVPFVNLIWRHIATVPGGLAWMWELSKPLYVSPDLGRAAAELRADLLLPPIEPLSEAVWTCVGVDRAQRATIASLIEDYNHANATNFLVLLAARNALLGESSPVAASAISPAPQPSSQMHAQPANTAPRLLGLDELPPAVLSLVLDLDSFARIRPNDAVASLYRHLAHWPPFLAMAHTVLLPHHTSGALKDEQERTIMRGRALAAKLTPLLALPTQALEAQPRQRILAALDEFTQVMIGRMIIMGGAMLALVPESRSSSPETAPAPSLAGL